MCEDENPREYTTQNYLFEIGHDLEKTWIVAANGAEAVEAFEGIYGVMSDIGTDGLTVDLLKPSKVITVRNEDDGTSESRTAAQWARDGSGILASTVV